MHQTMHPSPVPPAYRSEPGVAVHSPLNVGNMSGVHKWLNELIVASGGKPQGAIVPTTLIDMPGEGWAG